MAFKKCTLNSSEIKKIKNHLIIIDNTMIQMQLSICIIFILFFKYKIN